MKILATYNEINALVQQATGEDICLKRVENDIVAVGYTHRVGPFSPTVSVNITVESVRDEVIACRYGGGKATEMLLNLLKPVLARKGLDNIVQFASGNHLFVYLANIEGAENILQKATLCALSFEPENIVAEIVMK